MKQRYTNIGMIFSVLAVLSNGAYAAYQEEWMSPQALKKEEAARAHVCRNADGHCVHAAKSVAAKSRAEVHDDPIADFARKGSFAKHARVAAG